MKIVGFFLVFFILHLTGAFDNRIGGIDYDESTATTIIGTVNATYTWKIKNFNLMEWQLIQSPKSIIGPQLKKKNSKKNVNCSIIPEITGEKWQNFEHSNIREHRHLYTAIPKLVCEFNPEPTTVQYSYIGKKNEKMYGIEINPYDIEDYVIIVIHAIYSYTEYPFENID